MISVVLPLFCRRNEQEGMDYLPVSRVRWNCVENELP